MKCCHELLLTITYWSQTIEQSWAVLIYTTGQTFGVSKIFKKNALLILTKNLFDQNYSKNPNMVKYYYNVK